MAVESDTLKILLSYLLKRVLYCPLTIGNVIKIHPQPIQNFCSLVVLNYNTTYI